MLGVLGGGQLGRMFVHAAQTLGYRTAVLDPDAQSPAGLVSHLHLCVPYLDAAGLHTLASACLAVTIEFENVPADALQQLAARVPVAPGADALFICQDRALEKAHFLRSGVACAPWARIESDADIARADTGLLSTRFLDFSPACSRPRGWGMTARGRPRFCRRQICLPPGRSSVVCLVCLKRGCRCCANSACWWRVVLMAKWCTCRRNKTCTATASWR